MAHLVYKLERQDMESKAKAWIRRDLNGPRRTRLFLKRIVVVLSWPLLGWRCLETLRFRLERP